MRSLYYFIILILVANSSFSQLDSLKKVWENESNLDTVRLEAFKNYIWMGYMFTDPDSALILSKTFYDFARDKDKPVYMGGALNHQAVALSMKGDADGSLALFYQALEVYKTNHIERLQASTYSNIGTILRNQGRYKEAAECFFNSLVIADKFDDKLPKAGAYNNLGVLYYDQGLLNLSRKYQLEALAIKLELGNDVEIGMGYFNIGGLDIETGNIEEGIANLEKSYEYFKKSDYKVGIGNYYIQMGQVYEQKIDYEQSLENFRKGLENFQAVNDVRNMTISEMHIGIIYRKLGNNDLALKYLREVYIKSQELQLVVTTQRTAKELYFIYREQKKYDKALEYFEIFHEISDSVNSIQKTEETVNLKYQYEYDKKALIDSIDFAKSQALNELEIKEQKSALAKAQTERYALFGGIALLLFFGLFVLRSYRRKKQDHDIISDQHKMLSQSHLEIRQSIDYAKKLQDAILPRESTLKAYFENYFILFKPKDIVSGDFYWFEHDAKTNTKLFAVADCTGHGVPGAMVSLVCATALNRCVNELGILQPAEILNKSRELIIETFSKQQHNEFMRDGMDITICAINSENECTVSAAYNKLWCIMSANPDEIIEYRGNNQSVGWTDKMKPFTQEKFQLEKGDLLYLQSDGFVDQFGGQKNKKFNRGNLRKLILSISSLPLEEQKDELNTAFESWKANFAQVDDVCVMAIKI